jgi:hypothetical protein
MDFRRVYIGAGRKCEGRPTVWETCEVFHLSSLPRTNLKKALGRALPALYAGTGLTPCLQISTMHQDPAPSPDNTPLPYDTNAYPGRRSSSTHSALPHIYHPTRRVAANIMTRAQRPLVQH